MRRKDMHLGKSYRDKIRYGRKLKSLTETEETIPKKDFDSSDSSTSGLDLTITPQKKRPRTLSNILLSKQTFSIANILKGFFSLGGLALISILIGNIFALNRDLGRVEERVKDISILNEKVDKIYEKLSEIDKGVYKIMVEIEKNNEINNHKFDTLDNRIDSIEKK